MPNYNDLRPHTDLESRDFALVFPQMSNAERVRCIRLLLDLKQALAGLPERRTEKNLLVASWNIQALGSGDMRLPESFYYIAEILSCFDLIAVQELRQRMADLEKVVRILGPSWRFQVNDSTGGDAGNDERSAYVFNTDRVTLAGVAGELSIWDELWRAGNFRLPELKRPPYMTGFVTAWKRFALISLHLHPGKGPARPPKPSDAEIRQDEIRMLLDVLADRKQGLWTRNLVLVGDMNFYKDHDQATIDLIHAAGFFESGGLVGKTTNVTVDPRNAEAYDRMFFNSVTEDYFAIAETEAGLQSGGVFNPFDSILRTEDWALFREDMIAARDTAADKEKLRTDDSAALKYFRDTFRKRQLSDHLPIWVELDVDDSAAFLSEKLSRMT